MRILLSRKWIIASQSHCLFWTIDLGEKNSSAQSKMRVPFFLSWAVLNQCKLKIYASINWIYECVCLIQFYSAIKTSKQTTTHKWKSFNAHTSHESHIHSLIRFTIFRYDQRTIMCNVDIFFLFSIKTGHVMHSL